VTAQEFFALPDREKDALVAEKVMGWRRFEGRWTFGADNEPRGIASECPCYSTDIAAAWEVRNIVHEWIFSKRLAFKRELQLAVSQRVGGRYVLAPEEIILLVEPVDICLAALMAVGAIG
jgi:hypothetical protein